MRNLVQFAAFQGVWFAAVLGAARGEMLWGPLAAAAFFVLHLSWVERGRAREAAYVLGWGLAGTALDSGLHRLGVTAFPTSEWEPAWMAPPWIAALWFAFAMLPRFSLAWLKSRTGWAVLLGAVGGPLSFYGGARLGATEFHADPIWTWVVLGAEYAVLVPLMLAFAPTPPPKAG